ncbi:hypothetical protein LTR94_034913, partial [Friedmanniomyces endolithicus]
ANGLDRCGWAVERPAGRLVRGRHRRVARARHQPGPRQGRPRGPVVQAERSRAGRHPQGSRQGGQPLGRAARLRSDRPVRGRGAELRHRLFRPSDLGRDGALRLRRRAGPAVPLC